MIYEVHQKKAKEMGRGSWARKKTLDFWGGGNRVKIGPARPNGGAIFCNRPKQTTLKNGKPSPRKIRRWI